METQTNVGTAMHSKATPGPWNTYDAITPDGRKTIGIEGPKQYICTMDLVSVGGSPYRLPDCAEANAKLIAASPELYAFVHELATRGNSDAMEILVSLGLISKTTTEGSTKGEQKTQNRTLTITMTGRPPVIIREDEWPLLASAASKEYEGQVECQSFRISTWWVGVRKHEDGCAIVYARYRYDTAWQKERSLSTARGVLIPDATPDGICRAIGEVCDDIAETEHNGDDYCRWPTLRDHCIADMPAEVLVSDGLSAR